MERVVPLLGALVCGVAAVFWIRAARSRRQLADRLATEGAESDLWRLADADSLARMAVRATLMLPNRVLGPEGPLSQAG